MNECGIPSSCLFPLPHNFPAADALKSLGRMKQPEPLLRKVLTLDPTQYFKFLRASLEASTYAPSWYKKNKDYIIFLKEKFLGVFADPSATPNPHLELEIFHEQLIQKKRVDRIQTLYQLIENPQIKEELIKQKILDCLESFLKIRKFAHQYKSKDALNELEAFFRDQPAVRKYITTNEATDIALLSSTIISRLGQSKEFERCSLGYSLIFLEDCYYTRLKIPHSMPKEAHSLPLLDEVANFNVEQMSDYFEDKTEAFLRLVQDLLSFSISVETIYTHQKTIGVLIETFQELVPSFIHKHGSKNPKHAIRYRTLLALLKKRREAAITEQEGLSSDMKALNVSSASHVRDLPKWIKENSTFLKKLCDHIPPLKALNLVQTSSSTVPPVDWAEEALERAKPHLFLIGLYLSEVIISEKKPAHRQKAADTPKKIWGLTDFTSTFENYEDNLARENLEFLKNLLATAAKPETYQNFLPPGFKSWYPDLGDFPSEDYINYIFELHAVGIGNFLNQSRNFIQYKEGMIRSQQNAFTIEQQAQIRGAAAAQESFFSALTLDQFETVQLDEPEERENFDNLSEEELAFYNSLESFSTLGLVDCIKNQADEIDSEKAAITLKLVLFYVVYHPELKDPVVEVFKKNQVNQDKLRSLLKNSKFLEFLNELLPESPSIPKKKKVDLSSLSQKNRKFYSKLENATPEAFMIYIKLQIHEADTEQAKQTLNTVLLFLKNNPELIGQVNLFLRRTQLDQVKLRNLLEGSEHLELLEKLLIGYREKKMLDLRGLNWESQEFYFSLEGSAEALLDHIRLLEREPNKAAQKLKTILYYLANNPQLISPVNELLSENQLDQLSFILNDRESIDLFEKLFVRHPSISKEKKVGISSLNKEDQIFYSSLTGAPPEVLALFIIKQVSEKNLEKAASTLKIVFTYLNNNPTLIDSVAEILRKNRVDKVKLRQLIEGHMLNEVLDELLSE